MSDAPTENPPPENASAPEVSLESYERDVRTLTTDLRQALLARREDHNEDELGTMAEYVRVMPNQFGEDPVREEVIHEISGGEYASVVTEAIDSISDMLQSKAEDYSPRQRGFVVGTLQEAVDELVSDGAPSALRSNPEDEEKPWWVDDPPDNPDQFSSRNTAEQRSHLLGCDGEIHSHVENGQTFYMPCSDHDEWKEARRRENPSKNFHEAKLSAGSSDDFETYRRDDDPDGFDRGIQALYGIRPEDEEGPEGGQTELVSVFYPAERWNAANAERHAEGTFESPDFQAATRSNPTGPGARDVRMVAYYNTDKGRRGVEELIRFFESETDTIPLSEITFVDRSRDSDVVEVGIEAFGTDAARRLHTSFENWAQEDAPDAAMMVTSSLGLPTQINSRSGVHVMVDVMYDAEKMPGTGSAQSSPDEDPVFQDLRQMVKGEHNGWVEAATDHATPRTVRFGFARVGQALRAERNLKEALAPHENTRVHMSKIADESKFAPRSNPEESEVATVSVRTNRLGLGATEGDVESVISDVASSASGATVGRENPVGGSVKRHFARFNSADDASQFVNDLNQSLQARGLGSVASAEQGLPTGEQVGARENPSGKSAVVRLSMNTSDVSGDAPDLLTLAERATEDTGAEISGARQSESAGQRDYLVSAPTTSEARSVINQFNSKASTLGIANATSATLEHEAQRENRPRQNRSGEGEVQVFFKPTDPAIEVVDLDEKMERLAQEYESIAPEGVRVGIGSVRADTKKIDLRAEYPDPDVAEQVIGSLSNVADRMGLYLDEVNVSESLGGDGIEEQETPPPPHEQVDGDVSVEVSWMEREEPRLSVEKVVSKAKGTGGYVDHVHPGSGFMRVGLSSADLIGDFARSIRAEHPDVFLGGVVGLSVSTKVTFSHEPAGEDFDERIEEITINNNGGHSHGRDLEQDRVDHFMRFEDPRDATEAMIAARKLARDRGVDYEITQRSTGDDPRRNPEGKGQPAVVRIGVQKENLPSDAPDPLSMVEEVASENGGEISGVNQGGGSVDYEVEAPTTSEAQSIVNATQTKASTLGIGSQVSADLQHEARGNPSSDPSVAVRYPARDGLDQTVQQAAENAGGSVQRINQTRGPAYDGMKLADVRFNSDTEAFEGQSQIESSLRSEGVGEFETRTSMESPPPPLRPNPLFPSGTESEVSVQTEAPETPGESLVSVASSGEGEVVEEARRLGEERGMEDGLPDFTDEQEAFAHAAETLAQSNLFEDVDTSTPNGVDMLEKAASAWTNAYAEATGENWPRINPDLDREARPNPEEAPEGAATSYLGLTALALGGGIIIGDIVLRNKRSESGPTEPVQ